jgi:hypothetical protein
VASFGHSRDGARAPARYARRALLGGVAGAALGALLPRRAAAFGEEGAFHPRVLLTGNATWEGVRTTAPSRWSFELTRRTSAPARLVPTTVRADEPELLAEPFAVWGGDSDVPPLTSREIGTLRRFIALGGVLFVDDFSPTPSADFPDRSGTFGRAARRELARVIPEGSPIPIGPEHVVFRSFYLLRRAAGRADGPAQLQAIVRGGSAQVIFSSHDLLGALARAPSGVHPLAMGESQRERSLRLAVNLAMYVLCSNYKDDQVHAPFLMRRRPSDAP